MASVGSMPTRGGTMATAFEFAEIGTSGGVPTTEAVSATVGTSDSAVSGAEGTIVGSARACKRVAGVN